MKSWVVDNYFIMSLKKNSLWSMLEHSSARELDLDRAWIQPESDNQKTIHQKFSTFFPKNLCWLNCLKSNFINFFNHVEQGKSQNLNTSTAGFVVVPVYFLRNLFRCCRNWQQYKAYHCAGQSAYQPYSGFRWPFLSANYGEFNLIQNFSCSGIRSLVNCMESLCKRGVSYLFLLYLIWVEGQWLCSDQI